MLTWISSLISSIQSILSRSGSLVQPLVRIPPAFRIVALLAAIIAVACYLASRFYPDFVRAYWPILMGIVVALIVLAFFMFGVPAIRRRRFIRARAGDRSQVPSEPHAALAAGLLNTLAEIEASASRTNPRPLYRIPWFLVLGDNATNATAFLNRAMNKAALTKEPVTTTAESWWVWRRFKALVAIETHPGLVEDTGGSQRETWYEALRLLHRHRRKMPLNGVIVLVSAEILAGTADEVQALGRRFRQLIHDIMTRLEIHIPMYVVVTRVDALDGAPQFITALPQEVRSQVVGHRFDTQGPEPTADLLGDIMKSLAARLHAVRLSALRNVRDDDAARRGIFVFVDRLADLEQGLATFVSQLLEKDATLRSSRWRGLYFTGSQASPAFVDDLFSHFLPLDQPLSSRTRIARSARTLFTGAALCATTVALYLLWDFFTITTDQIHAAEDKVKSECTHVEAITSPKERIDRLTNCRLATANLMDITSERPLTKILYNVDDKAETYRQAFATQFAALLEEYLAPATPSEGGSFIHVLATAQRLNLLRMCQTGNTECVPRGEYSSPLFVKSTMPDVINRRCPSPPANVIQQDKGDHKTVVALLSNFATYAAWLNPAAREAQIAASRTALENLLARGLAEPHAMREWALQCHAPLGIRERWNPPQLGDLGLDVPDTSSVNPAFLHMVRNRDLAPLTAALADEKNGLKRQEAEFWESYWRTAFEEWRNFITAFPGGKVLWKGNVPGLLALMSSEKRDPYVLLFEGIKDELISAVPETVARPIWLVALERDLGEAWPEAKQMRQEMLYKLNIDESGSVALRMATQIFLGRSGTTGEYADKFRALWNTVEQPHADVLGRLTDEDDLAIRNIFHEPAKLLLEAIIARAADVLERRWQTERLTLKRGFEPGSDPEDVRVARALTNVFINDRLIAFLDSSRAEAATDPIVGQSFPLALDFESFLKNFRSLKDDPSTIRGEMILTRESHFESSNGALPASGTTVKLDCEPSVTISTAQSPGIDLESVFSWSSERCSRVAIMVGVPGSLNDTGMERRMNLRKNYRGDDGFQLFRKTFNSGRYSFGIKSWLEEGLNREALTDLFSRYGVDSLVVFLTVKVRKQASTPRLPMRLTEPPQSRPQL